MPANTMKNGHAIDFVALKDDLGWHRELPTQPAQQACPPFSSSKGHAIINDMMKCSVAYKDI